MLDRLTTTLNQHASALQLRAERQQVLSSNIANADTPGYQARDFDFGQRLRDMLSEAGTRGPSRLSSTDARHLGGIDRGSDGSYQVTTLKYRVAEQASLDGNTVDIDRERANFADNALRYEASLKFINGSMRKILSAIRGE
ncbi:MAG: flagellar basal body rod protein FlgB [Burkholderiaceae bacterium]